MINLFQDNLLEETFKLVLSLHVPSPSTQILLCKWGKFQIDKNCWMREREAEPVVTDTACNVMKTAIVFISYIH